MFTNVVAKKFISKLTSKLTSKPSRIGGSMHVLNHSRAGNALVAAMGIVVIVAGVVLVSSTNASQGVKNQAIQRRQTEALAALEAVLTRRETMVATMAVNGNPAWGSLVDWDGITPPNYGMDVVGDCLVRWRIEPGRTVKGNDINPTTPPPLKYILNPPPDGVAPNEDLNAVQNGYSYLYRVVAEAEYPAHGSNESPSLAQGARYVSVSALPTFRWVIDYTRNGPLGDLELSHDPAVRIRGNINSNGAIYFGSNLQVNDWAALAGGSGTTLVGPDIYSGQVVASGFDGIYRLSKPNNYGYLNKFPMDNGPSCTDPTTLMTSGAGAGGVPLFADIPNLNYGTWSTFTMNGRFMNPYRIVDLAGLTTLGTAVRQINGNSVIGSTSGGGSAANDSRDAARTNKFATLAPGSAPLGFSNFARTAQTTARREVLSKEFLNRALEPQIVTYRETDGDVLTDDHDFALPQFYQPIAGSSPTTTVNPVTAAAAVQTVSGSASPRNSSGNLLVEVPGHYVAKALGSGNVMTRLSDGTGWTITNSNGIPVDDTVVTDLSAGLVIRERPVPLTSAWPANTDATRYIQFSDPQALPYALGKHWRPVKMPFTATDISENLYTTNNDSSWANTAPFNQPAPTGGWDRSATYPQRAALYKFNGLLSLIGGHGNRTAEYETDIKVGIGESPGLSYVCGSQYHTANWRLVHLKNRYGLTDEQIVALPNGLRYSYWNDDSRLPGNATAYGRLDQVNNRDVGSSNPTCQPLLGKPVATGISTSIDNDRDARPWLPADTPATALGDLVNYYSARWEGFLIPPQSGAYTFQLKWDDCVRIWIDDQLVTENWGHVGSLFVTNPVTMVANRPAKIVIDFTQGVGEHYMQLRWSGPGLPAGYNTIASTALRAAPAIGGFERAKFNSITARIDTSSLATIATGAAGSVSGLSALTNPKIGLMVRPDLGEPNLVNGRDAYLALCWSPQRGVFIERRMDPARVQNRLSTAKSQWIGGGTYKVGTGAVTNASAVVPTGVVPTPIGYSGTYAETAYTVTRSATIKCAVGTPVAGAVSSSTKQNWGNSTTASPSTASVNLGDGNTVDVLSGPYTIKYTPNTFIRKTRRVDRIYTWTITGGAYPDVAKPSRPAITLFATASTSTTSSSYTTFDAGSYTVVNATTLTIPQGEPFTADGATLTGTAVTNGSAGANNIWQPSGGWPSGYSGTSLVAKLNSINYKGRNDWVLGNGSGTISAPSTFPSLSPIAPADPMASALPVLYDTSAHSFTMDVTPGHTLNMDSNPFVTRSGIWSPTLVSENRPWGGAAWDAFSFEKMLTQSFRPDLANTLATGATVALTEALPARAAAAPTPAASTSLAPVPWSDDTPLTVLNNSVWLRIVQNPTTRVVTFQYSTGATAAANGQWLASGGWTNLPTAEPVTLTAVEWDSLLAGPVIQSGNVGTALSANLDSLSVATTENIGNNDEVWDFKDWDGSTGLPGVGSPLSRYYASQYQAFFGKYDITEDFFTWGDETGNSPIASEDWFYNPREFWSQSDTFQFWDPRSAFSTVEPWGVAAQLRPEDKINYRSRWNPATGWVNAYTSSATAGAYTSIANPYSTTPPFRALLKDGNATDPWGDLTNRQNLAKTTVLTLDLKSLSTYLKTRTVVQAKTRGLLDGSSTSPAAAGSTLDKTFNGLIYAARTNRYPFNPNQPLTDPSEDPAFAPGVPSDPTRIGGANPWSFKVRGASSAVPDSAEYLNFVTPVPTSPKSTTPNYTPLSVSGTTATWTPSVTTSYYRNGALYTPAADPSLSKGGINKLQPYAQVVAYPVRPQHFNHGVMLVNGANINWGLPSSGSANFGKSGTSIVTPNAMYLKGDFNTTTNSVLVSGVATEKITPVAVMGDSITLLSNAFSVSTFQRRGLTVSSGGGISGSGILANPSGAAAKTTTYNAGFITHNQPTTQARVLEGQGAAFIDTMMFLENWSGVTMNYTGSLVVMDTRRYTDAFLLDGNKVSGRSPLGYLGWAATVESGRSGPGLPTASTWPGPVPKVYSAPARNFDYQFDFRTGPGTPPFVPNGFTTVGVGGWTMVIQ